MQSLSVLFFWFFWFFQVSSSRNLEPRNLTQLETTSNNSQNDLTSLQDTMAALNALSATQKQLLEQQRIREEELRTRHREEEQREAARSLTLKSEQSLLEEIRGTVHRKIKSLSKSNAQASSMATQVVRPKDCGDVYLEGDDKSGVYTVWPLWSSDQKSCTVYCDMETDGGGWTVIHRWKHPEVPKTYFQRSWKDYKKGFGDPESAFWLGNECIHELTSQGYYQLRFDFDNKHSLYQNFFIDGEDHYYKLHLDVSKPVFGDGGDVLSVSKEANFSTYDQNNIKWIRREESSYIYTRRSTSPEWYQPQCVEGNVGWWHSSTCGINSLIHGRATYPSSVKAEMKIRSSSFTRKKEPSP